MESAMRRDLQLLIEKARKIEMTPEQARTQRRSFVYGNTHIENEHITREMVAAVDSELEASCVADRPCFYSAVTQ
jgi:hypothetical protein